MDRSSNVVRTATVVKESRASSRAGKAVPAVVMAVVGLSEPGAGGLRAGPGGGGPLMLKKRADRPARWCGIRETEVQDARNNCAFRASRFQREPEVVDTKNAVGDRLLS